MPSTTSPSALPDLLSLIDALSPARRERVFRHSSWPGPRVDSYERLEFLGDAVLGLAIADELCRRFPDAAEGVLARQRAQVVSRASCARVAGELRLGQRLVALGDELGRDDAGLLAAQGSVLAALVESAIGAIFLTVGFASTAIAVVAAFTSPLAEAASGTVDHKTTLQEIVQRQGRSVRYAVVSDIGPPHARQFTSAALVGDRELGRGVGVSKKASEQSAARAALDTVNTGDTSCT